MGGGMGPGIAAAAAVSGGDGATVVEITDEPARIDFERQLGDALNDVGKEPRDLVLAWDRKQRVRDRLRVPHATRATSEMAAAAAC